ncbi:hypothetical protein ACFWP3_37785 [Streptomyces sp. NPDC058525]|uniref:hypothetical protein n=1 Tax=Streptomyces sp. NPDC058525 TaxID=3346538 RepID=UPI00365D32D9
MSEHTHPTSWIETELSNALVPESRRAEFLEGLDGASWVPVQGTHPFSQGYAVRAALSRIPDALEATYSQTWTVRPDEEGERHYTVIGLRTRRQEIVLLDDGDMTVQGVLIRPATTG